MSAANASLLRSLGESSSILLSVIFVLISISCAQREQNGRNTRLVMVAFLQRILNEAKFSGKSGPKWSWNYMHWCKCTILNVYLGTLDVSSGKRVQEWILLEKKSRSYKLCYAWTPIWKAFMLSISTNTSIMLSGNEAEIPLEKKSIVSGKSS